MPAISPTQFVIFIIIFLVGFGIYSIWNLRDKIYCTFIREDKTVIQKFAKVKAGRIDFDGGWYNLDIKRTTLKLVWVSGIFPTWIRCLIFRFDSNKPLDPTNWSNDYDRPEDRKSLNRSENIQSLMANTKTSLLKGSGKKSMLENLMPIIMIGGFVIIGYLVYTMKQNQDLLGSQSNILQQQLLDLMKALGK